MSPGIITVSGNFTLTSTYVCEISASGPQYNDEIRATGQISLQTGADINLQRYPALPSPDPSFGQRFTILKAYYNNSPSPIYTDNFPSNIFTVTTTDTDGRYLLVTPADTGTVDGFPHTSDEYAVYFVRGAAGYVFPGVSPTVTQWIQTNAQVGAGGLLENTGSVIYSGQVSIDPVAASLMVMNDDDLYAALLTLTLEENQRIAEENERIAVVDCVNPPYNATNFTAANNNAFNTLVKYAKTQPQYPLNTASNASQIVASKQNISYFNAVNQQTQAVQSAPSPLQGRQYPQFKSQTERLMYIQGMTLTAARNQITGQNPSGPAGVPCSTIYQIINS